MLDKMERLKQSKLEDDYHKNELITLQQWLRKNHPKISREYEKEKEELEEQVIFT